MFVHLDRIHERDGRTDRRTPHDGIGRACIALRGKNAEVVQCRLLSGLFVNCSFVNWTVWYCLILFSAKLQRHEQLRQCIHPRNHENDTN